MKRGGERVSVPLSRRREVGRRRRGGVEEGMGTRGGGVGGDDEVRREG